jgi:hypothetical protein
MNIKSSISKLDEIIKPIEGERYEAWLKRVLKDFLLSIQQPEDDELDTYEVFRENVRMTLKGIEDRIARLEEKMKEDFSAHMEANEDIYKRLQKQIDILKDYSHRHYEEDETPDVLLSTGGITFPYNPDYEPSSVSCKHEKVVDSIPELGRQCVDCKEFLPAVTERYGDMGIKPSSVSSLNEACKPFYKGDGYSPSSVSECKSEIPKFQYCNQYCEVCHTHYPESFNHKCPPNPSVEKCVCKKPGQTIWVTDLKNPVCKDCVKPVFPSVEKCDTITISRKFLKDLLSLLDNAITDGEGKHCRWWVAEARADIRRALSKEGK